MQDMHVSEKRWTPSTQRVAIRKHDTTTRGNTPGGPQGSMFKAAWSKLSLKGLVIVEAKNSEQSLPCPPCSACPVTGSFSAPGRGAARQGPVLWWAHSRVTCFKTQGAECSCARAAASCTEEDGLLGKTPHCQVCVRKLSRTVACSLWQQWPASSNTTNCTGGSKPPLQ